VSERIEAVDRPASHTPLDGLPRLAAGLVIVRAPFDDADPQWVVTQALAELEARYDDLSPSEFDHTHGEFDPPSGVFLVARVPSRDRPVGGVGVRPTRLGEPGSGGAPVGEIKRLWVDPDHRGQGTAKALMSQAEAAARALGYVALRLETGERQPEAIALYAALGWTRSDRAWTGGPAECGEYRFAKDIA
jgi:GNAT superfamily N-acetyltransferase